MKLRLVPLLLFCLTAAAAEVGTDSPIVVEQAWSRASRPESTTGILYLSIENRGETADRLIGVATPVAGMAAVHEVVEENGMVGMQPVPALTIAPGERTVLAPLSPRGLHVMLTELAMPLHEGDTIPVVLTFETAGAVEIEAAVGAETAMEFPGAPAGR